VRLPEETRERFQGTAERSPHGPIDPWYTEPARKRGSLGPSGRRPRRWLSRILIVGVFFGCLALIGVVVDRGVHWVEGRSSTTTTEAARGATVEVVISPGTTATQVGTLLEEQGVIESSAAFVDLVKSRGSESKLRPGIYQFSVGQELLKVVDMLEQGQGSVSFKLTIPEGMAASQVAALLTEEGTVTGESYLQLSGQPAKFVVPKVGGAVPKVTTLEGLLFPSTYYLLKGDGATEVIGAQLAAFAAKTASLPWSKSTALGLTPYQIVIVASLIEKEASIASERAMVAAVIYNRLKKDMTLGVDATVRYADGPADNRGPRGRFALQYPDSQGSSAYPHRQSGRGRPACGVGTGRGGLPLLRPQRHRRPSFLHRLLRGVPPGQEERAGAVGRDRQSRANLVRKSGSASVWGA
jgi:uncharacterized YceG family protein